MHLNIFADNTADGNQGGNGDIWGAKIGYKTATHYQWRIDGTIFAPKYAPLSEGTTPTAIAIQSGIVAASATTRAETAPPVQAYTSSKVANLWLFPRHDTLG